MAELNAKQMRQLLQSISTDPQLKQSKDTILLAEDQYPEVLDAIFTRLTNPSSLQNTINLLQWDRKAGGSYDAKLKATTISSQSYMRATYQLTPTADNSWDTYTFRQWKHFVTNLCLSAVQEALKTGDNIKTMQHLFTTDRTAQIEAHHNSKNNVQGMLLLYHPLLLKSPWQAPDDLDRQIEDSLAANEPALVARSMSTSETTSYNKDNAIKQLEVITASINLTLLRIYTLSSHSFHVLVRELIPRARFDQSSLFTHIKGARTEDLITLRAYHGKTWGVGAAVLTKEQLKPHSAAHTLKFIEDTYVEIDDDAPHYTWSDIITATRTTRMTIFAWVDSFTILKLRYGDIVKKITTGQNTKINKVISKQITDDEKATIATLDTLYSALSLNAGQYIFTNLVKLLAQNVTSFTKRYVPSEHVRIANYLRTRAVRYKNIFLLASQGSKEKGTWFKRQKIGEKKGQRGWVYVEEATPSGLTAPAPYSKGKGKGKGKGNGEGKGKDKGKVHLSPTYGKGKHKGKGQGKSKGKSKGKGKAKGMGLLSTENATYFKSIN
jgi:hypothetical protein